MKTHATKHLYKIAEVSDIAAILTFEKQVTGSNKGDDNDLLQFLTGPSGYGGLCFEKRLVRNNALIGLILFDIYHDRSEIIVRELLVHPLFRRQGIATALIEKVQFLCDENHFRAVARVPETCLPVHLFFRSINWKCDKVLKQFFAPLDAYRFRSPTRPPLFKNTNITTFET